MSTSGSGLSRDAYIMLAASFFYLGSTMLVTPVISGFAGSLGATAAFMGVIGGLMNVCSLVVRPIAGNLSDIMRKRRIATIGSIVLAVSTSLYAVATDPVQIAVLRLVSGAGYAFCSVCMSTWFASLLPPEHVGSGMGMFGMMNALGMAVAASGQDYAAWHAADPAAIDRIGKVERAAMPDMFPALLHAIAYMYVREMTILVLRAAALLHVIAGDTFAHEVSCANHIMTDLEAFTDVKPLLAAASRLAHAPLESEAHRAMTDGAVERAGAIARHAQELEKVHDELFADLRGRAAELQARVDKCLLWQTHPRRYAVRLNDEGSIEKMFVLDA